MLNPVHEVRNGPQMIGWTKHGLWEISVHLTAKCLDTVSFLLIMLSYNKVL